MIDGLFAYAFTTGMLATVNPCGFAMLPAYLSYFLGIDSTRVVASIPVVKAYANRPSITTGTTPG